MNSPAAAAALLLVACAASAGCAAYTRAEMDLVTQARRGIETVARHDAARDGAAAQLAKLRRQKLDEAFDADVRERATQEALDPDWVIEARRAYAVGIEAYARAQAVDDRAALARRQTLDATAAALDRLHWMQSVRGKFDLFDHPEPQEEQP